MFGRDNISHVSCVASGTSPFPLLFKCCNRWNGYRVGSTGCIIQQFLCVVCVCVRELPELLCLELWCGDIQWDMFTVDKDGSQWARMVHILVVLLKLAVTYLLFQEDRGKWIPPLLRSVHFFSLTCACLHHCLDAVWAVPMLFLCLNQWAFMWLIHALGAFILAPVQVRLFDRIQRKKECVHLEHVYQPVVDDCVVPGLSECVRWVNVCGFILSLCMCVHVCVHVCLYMQCACVRAFHEVCAVCMST